MKKQHSLWIEKYRSENLDQYIGNEDVKARIADCIDKQEIPHFIFAGSAGTGKTTLAKLIVKNIQCDYLYLNASDENGIDVGEFASKHGGGGHKHAAGLRKESSW